MRWTSRYSRFLPAPSRQRWSSVGEKKIAGAVLIPSGFAETGNQDLQDEIVAVARQHNIRLMGPNIYGFYYTPKNLCATFCTPYNVKGKVALSSQSGGVGMAIVGFSRSARMGVSAIVGLGNKSDIDEDDLLDFFEQDDNTQAIAMHFEDLKDGRAFAEAASRVSKKKPVIALKAAAPLWVRAPPALTPPPWPAMIKCTKTFCAKAEWCAHAASTICSSSRAAFQFCRRPRVKMF